jgi:hypothetical protein
LVPGQSSVKEEGDMPDFQEERPLAFRIEQSFPDPTQFERLSETLNPILQQMLQLETAAENRPQQPEHTKFGLDFSKTG